LPRAVSAREVRTRDAVSADPPLCPPRSI
jgi:hypothetical protein